MITPLTPRDLFKYAHDNLLHKTEGKKRLTRKLFVSILKEEKKNRNHQLAIAKLSILAPFTRSSIQRNKLYEVIALHLSLLSYPEDVEFVRFILLEKDDEILKDMSWIVLYIFEYLFEEESREEIFEKIAFLDTLGLGFRFRNRIDKRNLSVA